MTRLLHLKTKAVYVVSRDDFEGDMVRARKLSDILKFDRVSTMNYNQETLNKKPLEKLSDFKIIY